MAPEPVGDDLLVRGAAAYPPRPDAEPVDVLVRGGWVVEVGRGLEAPGVPVLEAGGLCVIPGLVDVHVHFRDPGLAHVEGWEHGSAGALSGGVTSVVEVQNNPPLSTSGELLAERLEHVARRSRVDFGCLANLVPDSVEELGRMAPHTPAFKLFMGCSTGVGGVRDRADLERLIGAAAPTGRMLVAHCEDEALLDAGKRDHPDATVHQHHLVRSHAAEVEAIRVGLEVAEAHGVEFHVFHISTAEGVELVRQARARGARVSASTGPHYILLSYEDADRLGNRLKVNPSVKGPEDNAAILEGLRDGTVDAIGTDHAPHPLENKLRDYAHAPSGMPSVDLLWPLTWELVRRDLLDAETALASVTWRAAESLHLPHKGKLEPGYHGDLVLFDPASERPVVASEHHSRSKWSAYEGRPLAGYPEVVVRRGEVVFREGAVLCEGGGRPLDLTPPGS